MEGAIIEHVFDSNISFKQKIEAAYHAYLSDNPTVQPSGEVFSSFAAKITIKGAILHLDFKSMTAAQYYEIYVIDQLILKMINRSHFDREKIVDTVSAFYPQTRRDLKALELYVDDNICDFIAYSLRDKRPDVVIGSEINHETYGLIVSNPVRVPHMFRQTEVGREWLNQMGTDDGRPLIWRRFASHYSYGLAFMVDGFLSYTEDEYPYRVLYLSNKFPDVPKPQITPQGFSIVKPKRFKPGAVFGK